MGLVLRPERDPGGGERQSPGKGVSWSGHETNSSLGLEVRSWAGTRLCPQSGEVALNCRASMPVVGLGCETWGETKCEVSKGA